MRPPCAPAHLLRIKDLVREAGVEPSGLSIINRVLNQLSFSRMEPRARIELAFPLYRSGASPAMLAGLNTLAPAERIERSSDAYHASALPLSYTGWSRRADSNRHLSFTRALFFPLNHFDMERVTGFEPVSGPWQGPILAARRYPRGASGENRTLLASLEGWNSANKSHSL